MNTCEKILANEVDLWRAGKRVRAGVVDTRGYRGGGGGGGGGGGDGDGEGGGGGGEGEWMVTRIPLGRAHISSAGVARPGGGATFVYGAGSAKTRWKPFNRHKTLSRVDIMHIDL